MMMVTILTAMLSLPMICVDHPERLMAERTPRPVVVAVTNGATIQRVEAFAYLAQTRRLSGDAIRWERASVAVQVAMARHPFRQPGELVEYIRGASAFVDTPALVALRAVPRISLGEAVSAYLTANSPDVRRMYGELLSAVVENRINHCSFWR